MGREARGAIDLAGGGVAVFAVVLHLVPKELLVPRGLRIRRRRRDTAGRRQALGGVGGAAIRLAADDELLAACVASGDGVALVAGVLRCLLKDQRARVNVGVRDSHGAAALNRLAGLGFSGLPVRLVLDAPMDLSVELSVQGVAGFAVVAHDSNDELRELIGDAVAREQGVLAVVAALACTLRCIAMLELLAHSRAGPYGLGVSRSGDGQFAKWLFLTTTYDTP